MPPYSCPTCPVLRGSFCYTLACPPCIVLFFLYCSSMCYLWAHYIVSLLDLLVSIQEGVCLLYRTAFAGTITKSPLTKVFSQLMLNCKSFFCIKSDTTCTCVLCTKVSCNSYINYYITQIKFKTSPFFRDKDSGETD